jgi:hypothetical protein
VGLDAVGVKARPQKSHRPDDHVGQGGLVDVTSAGGRLPGRPAASYVSFIHYSTKGGDLDGWEFSSLTIAATVAATDHIVKAGPFIV